MKRRATSLRLRVGQARSVMRLLPWALCSLSGCELVEAHPRAPESAPEQSRVLASVYMNEWLSLGAARCRVTRAERLLTEPNDREPRRVSPDLKALALYTECTSPAGTPLTLEAALPGDTLVFLRQGQQARRAPSLRTKLSSLEEAPLVFEFEEREPLPLLRSFDARSGHATFTADAEVARVSFEAHAERQEVWLRERALDARFDAWLVRLVNGLTADARDDAASPPLAADDLQRLRALYAGLLERFEPTRLSLRELRQGEHGLTFDLVLERPRTHDAPNVVATFRFELPDTSDLAHARARLLDVTDGRLALECAERARALRTRVVSDPGRDGSCSLLGLKVPARCEHLDLHLKDELLAHRMRCVPGLADVAAQAQADVPDDFQITLRRGRRENTFDHGARFIVSLFDNGSVVFHGRSFVDGTGRSDGRTSQALLRRLSAQIERLDWFARRGGSWTPERCSPEDDRGDLITVQAHERQRMVVDREGCRGPFSAKELEELRWLLELSAGVSGWTHSQDAPDDEGVSEWTVSAD